jgi:phosphatidylglycerol---prolipoprotein diacylglyceryl transferase
MARAKTKKSNRQRGTTATAKTAAAKQALAKPTAASQAAPTPRQAPAKTAAARQAAARQTSATQAAARQAPAESAAVTEVPPGLQPATAAGLAPATDPPPRLALGGDGRRKAGPAKGSPDGQAQTRPQGTATVTAGTAPRTPPADPSDGLPGWATKAVAELLTVTYWLDPGQHGDPLGTTIRFSGRRTGVTGKPQPGDTFAQEETVEGIVPGSGPVAVTAEVRGIHAGDWAVTARPVARVGRSPVRPYPPPGGDAAGPRRAPWPRRVVIPADPDATVHTASLLFTNVPGIIRFAFASLVSLGVLAGLGLEALLLAGGHYPVLRPLVFSAAAVAAGVIGGKAWYVAVNRRRKFDGWCIQGFITGTAAVIAAAAFAGPGIPAGVFLAAVGPALLIGMAIGRPGCFWAGCCAGRPTASRRGIWSSDRRVGCRREPAQLLEALAALVIGVAVLAVVLAAGLPRSGPVAVAGLAAYTLSRQFIIGLRAEVPQRWRYGRQVTAVAAAIVLVVSMVLLVRG